MLHFRRKVKKMIKEKIPLKDEKYCGKYIAYTAQDELITYGRSYKEVYNRAKKKGHKVPILGYILPKGSTLVV